MENKTDPLCSQQKIMMACSFCDVDGWTQIFDSFDFAVGRYQSGGGIKVTRMGWASFPTLHKSCDILGSAGAVKRTYLVQLMCHTSASCSVHDQTQPLNFWGHR